MLKFKTKWFNNKRYFSDFVKIVEVGARDGLQNEKNIVNLEYKKQLIESLVQTGLRVVEVGSFVSPKWVPQMADTATLFSSLDLQSDVSYPCLVPNLKGLETALKVGVKEIAIFTAASESFTINNINCSINESVSRFQQLFDMAKNHNIKIRGYVSCVIGCPYEGPIKPEIVASLSKKLFDMGCYEVSLGDTIGKGKIELLELTYSIFLGTPNSIRTMLNAVLDVVPCENIAIHCHDTYGQAVANVVTAIEHGVRVIDSSISGLGGCPYAPGASGNVSTEDIVYCLQSLGFKTGLNLDRLIETSRFISGALSRRNYSKVTVADQTKCKHYLS